MSGQAALKSGHYNSHKWPLELVSYNQLNPTGLTLVMTTHQSYKSDRNGFIYEWELEGAVLAQFGLDTSTRALACVFELLCCDVSKVIPKYKSPQEKTQAKSYESHKCIRYCFAISEYLFR